MGELHIDIIKRRLKDEYGVEAYLGPLQVVYKAVVVGPTTFLAENGFGRTTIFDYLAKNVLAFSTFVKCDGPMLSN